MSDTIAQTPEAVALELLKIVAKVEGATLDAPCKGERDYILSTYAECLAVVRGDGKKPVDFKR